MIKTTFYKGKFKQWSCYRRSDCIIWVAGLNNKDYINNIFNVVNKLNLISKTICKKIVSNLGNHFGIIIISPNWSFAAVDYSRGFPIFWSISNGKIKLATQANLLKKKIINQEQLLAFRMSGYTTNDDTLWLNVRSLKAGSYLFFKNQKSFSCKRYFSYLPYEDHKISYKIYTTKLAAVIDKLIRNMIKDVKGKNIIIPLSAGLDSRLIVSGLKHFNYKNVKCFSYGLKNNYEATASKKICEKLGYEWIFVEINHKKAKKFYNSRRYKNYLKYTSDGCAASTIQGLLAINELVMKKYINREDILINGNSGDFISGGHIPRKISKVYVDKNNLKHYLDNIMKNHFEKHYSLWENLKTTRNKLIIKSLLKTQLLENLGKGKNPLFGLIELLEFENRQTKYVVNSQRIYDYYNLNWLLPLWDKSFMKFWEKVPLGYKLDQKLYKEALIKLNYGKVWTKKFNFKNYLSPNWMIVVRFFFKVFFIFLGKKRWRIFEKKYLNYWTENICGFSSISFFSFCSSKNIARNYVSLYTLISEKKNIGFNWQEKK